MKPEIVRVPARQGARWLLLSCRTFWRRPWIFVLLILLQMASVKLPSHFAPVLSNLVMLLAPFFVLAVMLAASQVDAGQRAGPAMQLMTSGRRRLLTLLALGVLCVLNDFGNDMLKAWVLDPAHIGQPPNLNMLFLAGLGSLALFAFLSLFLMLAPGLVHWYYVSLPQALLLSAGAVLRNWRAFALFGLLWGGVCGTALGMAAGFLMRAGVTGDALTATLIGHILVWIITLMIANFFILRDCFAAVSSPFPAASDTRLGTT
ncbi:MAG: hypothetical protein RR311_11125 [Comamonas sp.]